LIKKGPLFIKAALSTILQGYLNSSPIPLTLVIVVRW
jgi:hypothetical protein